MDKIKKIYRNRDEEVRATVPLDEAIRRIRRYGGEYDPTTLSFDVYDQLLACESVDESTPIPENHRIEQNTKQNGGVYGNGGIDDTCRRKVNFELTPSKLSVLSQLKTCTYRTNPPVIAKLLETYFEGCGSDPDWWLYVAQRWPPRPIWRVIDQLIKLQTLGRMTIRNPAKYFSFLIKKRKERR